MECPSCEQWKSRALTALELIQAQVDEVAACERFVISLEVALEPYLKELSRETVDALYQLGQELKYSRETVAGVVEGMDLEGKVLIKGKGATNSE